MVLRRSPSFFMRVAQFPLKGPQAQTPPPVSRGGADCHRAGAIRCRFGPTSLRMTATEPTRNHPPEAELQFDIGATDDPLERMIDLFARHGDTYRVYSPTRKGHIYVVHHPDDIKRVLVSNHRNYTKGMGLDRVKILLGKGLMTSEGELWKRQRYMMQPFFHRRVITEFAAMIDSANERFIARWEELAARGEPVNVTDEMSELTLSIVLR